MNKTNIAHHASALAIVLLTACGSAASPTATPVTTPVAAHATPPAVSEPERLDADQVLALLNVAAAQEVGPGHVDQDAARSIFTALAAAQQTTEMNYTTNAIGRAGIMHVAPTADPDLEHVPFNGEFAPCPEFITKPGRALSQLQAWTETLSLFHIDGSPVPGVEEQAAALTSINAELHGEVSAGRAIDVSVSCPSEDGPYDAGLSYVIRRSDEGEAQLVFWTRTTTGTVSTNPLSSLLFPLNGPQPNDSNTEPCPASGVCPDGSECVIEAACDECDGGQLVCEVPAQ